MRGIPIVVLSSALSQDILDWYSKDPLLLETISPVSIDTKKITPTPKRIKNISLLPYSI